MAYGFDDDKSKKNIQTKIIGINTSQVSIQANSSISFTAYLAESISDASIILNSELLLYEEQIPGVYAAIYGIIPLFCMIDISNNKATIAVMNFNNNVMTLFGSQVHIRVVYV